jgi:hypothetical protein
MGILITQKNNEYIISLREEWRFETIFDFSEFLAYLREHNFDISFEVRMQSGKFFVEFTNSEIKISSFGQFNPVFSRIMFYKNAYGQLKEQNKCRGEML